MYRSFAFPSRSAAFEFAWDELLSCAYYEYNECASRRAGYSIYSCTDVDAWISDLGTRLEVNLPDGSAVNVWYD